MEIPEKVIEAARRIQAGQSPLVPGKVVRADGRTTRFVSWQDADTKQGSDVELRVYNVEVPEGIFEKSPIVKRSWQQRVESLAKRLAGHVNSTHQIPDTLLREIEGEYWKAGQPVSFEALQRIAMRLLQEQDNRQRLSLVPDIATKTWSPRKIHSKNGLSR